LGGPERGLGGLKRDEIDAANSFPMLPMARNGLKWSVMSLFFWRSPPSSELPEREQKKKQFFWRSRPSSELPELVKSINKSIKDPSKNK